MPRARSAALVSHAGSTSEQRASQSTDRQDVYTHLVLNNTMCSWLSERTERESLWQRLDRHWNACWVDVQEVALCGCAQKCAHGVSWRGLRGSWIVCVSMLTLWDVCGRVTQVHTFLDGNEHWGWCCELEIAYHGPEAAVLYEMQSCEGISAEDWMHLVEWAGGHKWNEVGDGTHE